MKVRFFPALAALAALAVVLVLGAGCSGEDISSAYLAARRAELETPFSHEKVPTKFVVAPGTPARLISERLQAAGLIADARLFEAYVRASGLANQLEAGTFTLSPHMTVPQIAEALQNSRPEEMVIRVGEGWRLEQTADYLDVYTLLDGVTYRRRAETGDLSGLDASRYGFLAERPAGASLEGYLYPDSYRLVTETATADDLLVRQLDAFAATVWPVWTQAQAAGYNLLTLHEVLALASIVEREAAVDEERPVIAEVYLNRLATGMKLQADPTVQYAMGYQAGTGQWWKTPVFLEEYSKVDSPYNTYLYPGLPPGPIASPSLRSVQAVLAPAEHDYLYFVALPDGSGRHAFALTYEEHLENVKKYQAGQ